MKTEQYELIINPYPNLEYVNFNCNIGPSNNF